MRKTVVALFTLSLSAAACGNAGIPNPTFVEDDATPIHTATAEQVKEARMAEIEDELPFITEYPGEKESTPRVSPLAQRQVGDLSIQRFSGSFTKAPFTLSEEVIAKAGSLIVIDYTLEEDAQTTKLRVTHDVTTDRVLRVREMKGKKQLPSSTEAYETMLSRTMFVPDGNEGQVAKETTTCLIGERAVDCEKTSYQVTIGEEKATFSIARSSDGRDISGEISAPDGKVFYRAEVVEQRSGTPSGVASR